METENKYKYSKAYFKILDLIVSNPKETVFVIRGGQGASKTVSILELLIQSLLSSTKEISVISSELSKMKRTVIRDYKKIAKDWGVLGKDDFNRTESKHEYSNESYIDFLGADVNDIGKGFRRDIVYINEADKMDIDTAVQFISRAGLTIIDYNPDSLFWGDDYINENNFITLTFEDNEYLPKSEVDSILDYKTKGFHNSNLPFEELFKEENIKSSYWANKWRVYGLGMVGNLDGVVFDNWREIDDIPKEARLLGYGLDFGYSNDPAAITEIWKWNEFRILNEICYQKGLSNRQLAKKITTLKPCYCDSAEPKSIAELQDLGINAEPVTKGSDSINYGIQLMQEEKYLVTKKSVNLINELQKYTWQKDKRTNDKINKPIDKYNHCFIGSTLITTSKGLKRIDEIKINDLVLTSKGYERVLKTFDNGVKQTYKYSLQFDTFSLSLHCTDNHKIKTTTGWVKVKNLTEKHTIYTTEKVILVEERKDFIELFGSSITARYLKGFTSIISMVIKKITQLKIYKLLRVKSTLQLIQQYFIRLTLILQEKILKRIRINVENGTQAKRVLNGINNKLLNLISDTLHTAKENVKSVALNLLQRIFLKNSVQTIVKANTGEEQELITKKGFVKTAIQNLKLTNIQKQKIVAVNVQEYRQEKVYDIMVENTHEYFADGVLVHNCLDGIRYHEMETLGQGEIELCIR